MADTQAPSLFGNGGPPGAARVSGAEASGNQIVANYEARCLLDLLYDGLYMVFLLRNRYAPSDEQTFRDRIKQFLADFERGGKRLQASTDDVFLAKFAYCALVDEVVLMSKLRLREVWQRKPLQLELFGEQLAGERFFEHLETLRQGGAARVQVLEVFHMVLLMGFQGRYILEGTEKLNYLTGRLGDEIAQLRGKRAGFAPHWEAPDRVAHALKRDIPLWVIGSVFALIGLLAYLGLRGMLERQTLAELAPYAQLVKLAPQAANVTITLP